MVVFLKIDNQLHSHKLSFQMKYYDRHVANFYTTTVSTEIQKYIKHKKAISVTLAAVLDECFHDSEAPYLLSIEVVSKIQTETRLDLHSL